MDRQSAINITTEWAYENLPHRGIHVFCTVYLYFTFNNVIHVLLPCPKGVRLRQVRLYAGNRVGLVISPMYSILQLVSCNRVCGTLNTNFGQINVLDASPRCEGSGFGQAQKCRKSDISWIVWEPQPFCPLLLADGLFLDTTRHNSSMFPNEVTTT